MTGRPPALPAQRLQQNVEDQMTTPTLNQYVPAAGSRILSVGAARGNLVVTNDGTLDSGGNINLFASGTAGEGVTDGGVANGGTASLYSYGDATTSANGAIQLYSFAVGGAGSDSGGTAYAGDAQIVVNGNVDVSAGSNIVLDSEAVAGDSINGLGGVAYGGTAQIFAEPTTAAAGRTLARHRVRSPGEPIHDQPRVGAPARRRRYAGWGRQLVLRTSHRLVGWALKGPHVPPT